MLAIIDEEIRIRAVWCGVFAGVRMCSPLWHLATGFEFSCEANWRWEIWKRKRKLKKDRRTREGRENLDFFFFFFFQAGGLGKYAYLVPKL